MFDLEKILASKGFAELATEGKTLIQDFMKDTDGKSQMESIPIFLEFFKKLKASGVLEDGQKEKLIDTLKEGLSAENRLKLEMAMKMLKA